jgi:hypothetical protein
MMQGGTFTESKAACTTWKDVSKETFGRLVQFAYTGDYSVPEAVPREVGETSKKEELAIDAGLLTETYPEPVEESEQSKVLATVYYDSWGNIVQPRQRKKKTTRLPTCWNDFDALTHPIQKPRNSYTDCEPAATFLASHSYFNVFLCHAKLYIPGDLWLLDSLEDLALHKLHKTLCVFQFNDKNSGDVIELARCAYTDEGKGGEEGIGALRNLVCKYMTINSVVLTVDRGFMDFLEGGGDFVKDLWRLQVQGQQ